VYTVEHNETPKSISLDPGNKEEIQWTEIQPIAYGALRSTGRCFFNRLGFLARSERNRTAEGLA